MVEPRKPPARADSATEDYDLIAALDGLIEAARAAGLDENHPVMLRAREARREAAAVARERKAG